MDYPTGISTDEEKLIYCYEVMEKLRLAHNIVGAWYSKGEINTDDHKSLPESWVARLNKPEERLSDQDWEEFKKDLYVPLEKKILLELNRLKAAIASIAKDEQINDLSTVSDKDKLAYSLKLKVNMDAGKIEDANAEETISAAYGEGKEAIRADKTAVDAVDLNSVDASV